MGESPGRDEAERGRPFVGPTGQQLEEELLKVGLRRSELLIINAVCCAPPANKGDKMMQKAVKCCAPAFLSQLEDAYNRWGEMHIFAMGKWSALAVMGTSKGVMNARGFIRDEWTIKRILNIEE